MAKDGIIHVPMGLIQMNLSARALRLWILIRSFANSSFKAWPSRSTMLALMPGWDRSYIRRAREELVREGLLIVNSQTDKEDGGDTVNVYTLRLPPTHKKIYERGQREKSTPPGGLQAPRRGALKPPPLYIRIEDKDFKTPPLNLKQQKAGFSKARPEKEKIHPDTAAALDHIRKFYTKTTGQEMRLSKDHPKIISDLLGVYDLSRVKALWEVWFRAGPWDQWARRMGYALGAWAKAAPELADHDDFPRLRKKYQEATA